MAGRCRHRSHSPGWPITRCTDSLSCPQQVSPRWHWPLPAKRLAYPSRPSAVNRVEVEQMLRLDGRTEVTTQLVRGNANCVDDIRIEIHSRSANGNWTRHAVARAAVAQPETLPSALRGSGPPQAGGPTACEGSAPHRRLSGRVLPRQAQPFHPQTSTPRCAARVLHHGHAFET